MFQWAAHYSSAKVDSVDIKRVNGLTTGAVDPVFLGILPLSALEYITYLYTVPTNKVFSLIVNVAKLFEYLRASLQTNFAAHEILLGLFNKCRQIESTAEHTPHHSATKLCSI